MNKIVLSALVLGLGLVSCQKDYYLEDLNDAQNRIERLESINRSQSVKINELQGVINSLTIELDSAQEEIGALNINIEGLNIDINGLNDVIESKNVIIDSLLALEETNLSTIDSLTNEIHNFNVIVSGLNDVIIDLSNELEYLRNNPIEVIVEVERVVIRTVSSVSIREVEVFIPFNADASEDDINNEIERLSSLLNSNAQDLVVEEPIVEETNVIDEINGNVVGLVRSTTGTVGLSMHQLDNASAIHDYINANGGAYELRFSNGRVASVIKARYNNLHNLHVIDLNFGGDVSFDSGSYVVVKL